MVADNSKNNKYHLFFWLSIPNQSNIEELNFDKLIQIKIQNEDFTTDIPRLTYNIIEKTEINDFSWYLLKYEFISGPTTQNKMQIFTA
jgi:hypothetical protein